MHVLTLGEEGLRQHGASVTRYVPSPAQLPFPDQGGVFPHAEELRSTVQAADGMLVATPEYHGSIPAELKLVLENLGQTGAVRGKPVALMGVSSGRFGAQKALEHLRSILNHLGALVVPTQTSVFHVDDSFSQGQLSLSMETSAQLQKTVRSLMELARCMGSANDPTSRSWTREYPKYGQS